MDDGKESIFNEAALKMKRIDNSWVIVNTLRTSLLDWNYELGKWNYEITINNLISSGMEAFSKMKKEEKELFCKFREQIIDMVESSPVYEKKFVSSMGISKSILVFNKDNWKKLRGMIFRFENFCREQQEIHGFSGHSKRDATKALLEF